LAPRPTRTAIADLVLLLPVFWYRIQKYQRLDPDLFSPGARMCAYAGAAMALSAGENWAELRTFPGARRPVTAAQQEW
jgi:hypothetical protein